MGEVPAYQRVYLMEGSLMRDWVFIGKPGPDGVSPRGCHLASRCRERAFEVDQPGIAMGRRELLLILLAQIPPTPAEEKFMKSGCSSAAWAPSAEAVEQLPAIGLLFWIDGSEQRHPQRAHLHRIQSI